MTLPNPLNAVVLQRSAPPSNQASIQLSLFDASGNPLVVPKQIAQRNDDAALTSAAATGGDAPTEAEYNALRTDVVNLRTVVNDLLAKMRTSGILAP